MPVPNTIVLISRGRHEEAAADNASILPGHLLQKQSDGGVIPHATPGGNTELLVAKEDVFQGGTIKGIYNQIAATYSGYASGDIVMYQVCAKGDLMLMRLQSGQNVARSVQLMSAGDGTLVAWFGPTLYQIVAPSATVTSVGVETTFSNGTYSIVANTLAAGDSIRITGRVFVIAENSTNTHQVKLYLGTAPITLLDATALQLAANDVVEFDILVTVRTIGATGTIVANGTVRYTISGTWTTKGVTVASTTLDTTAAEAIVVKVTPSASSAGNQVRLDDFLVTLNRTGGLVPLVQTEEAINNTGGTVPFVRVTVL